MISLMILTFIIGAMYGVSSSMTSLNQEATATLNLEEQIKEYEQTIAGGHEFNPPYSEQFVYESSDNLTQSDQQASLEIPQGIEIEASLTQKVNHNAISKLGQDIGTFLMSLVREILRAIVRFFDYLIAT